MPAPVIIAAAGQQAGSLVSSAIHAFAGGSLAALSRGALYTANRHSPNVAPPFDSILTAWFKGLTTVQGVAACGAWNGIALAPTERDANLSGWWDLAIEAAMPWPSVAEVLDIYRSGLHLRAKNGTILTVQQSLQRAGIWSSAMQVHLVGTDTPADEEMAKYLYYLVHQSQLRAREDLSRLGFVTASRQNAVLTRTAPVSPQDVLAAYNRGQYGAWNTPAAKAAAGLDLRRNGLYQPADWQRQLSLADQIPGPSDLVRFAVRDVWSRDIVQRFGYDAEFDDIPEFKSWMQAQGFGGSAAIAGGQPGAPETWAQAYWRAHWQLISPGQAYTMFHRLRPERMEQIRRQVPGVQPFTQADVAALLKTADYPPAFRDRLLAISYGLIPLRQMKQIADGVINRSGVGTRVFGGAVYVAADNQEAAGNVAAARAQRAAAFTPWLVESYRDRGLSPDDARLLATSDADLAQRKGIEQESDRVNRLSKRLAANALRQYRTGILPEDQLRRILESLDWGQRSITLAIMGENSEWVESIVRAGLGRSRADYFAGKLTIPELRERLRALGIAEAAVLNYADRWQAARGERIQLLSTSQIVGAVGQGFIPLPAALTRLENLGWSDADALLLLAGGAVRLQKTQAAMVRAQLQSRERAAKALELQAAKARANVKQIQSHIRQLTPPATLRRHYADGRINEVYLRRRLSSMGYDPPAIQLEIGLANDEARSATKKRRPLKHTAVVTHKVTGEIRERDTDDRQDNTGRTDERRVNVTDRIIAPPDRPTPKPPKA